MTCFRNIKKREEKRRKPKKVTSFELEYEDKLKSKSEQVPVSDGLDSIGEDPGNHSRRLVYLERGENRHIVQF